MDLILEKPELSNMLVSARCRLLLDMEGDHKMATLKGSFKIGVWTDHHWPGSRRLRNLRLLKRSHWVGNRKPWASGLAWG